MNIAEIQGIVHQCRAVVGSHYKLWAWLWGRRIQLRIVRHLAPFLPFA
jgi:hypothetical protein